MEGSGFGYPAVEVYFDHEKLRVYQEAISFITRWEELSAVVPGKLAVKGQLDRASTSIPLNIAEGNAKRSHLERRHYFESALGSVFKCAACLGVFVAKRQLTPDQVAPDKWVLHGLVSMLVRLTNRLSDRIADGAAEYCVPLRIRERDENENDGGLKLR